MSEDDALLRALVARPHDALARLVYADWLDERGDPRGAYLHAEREAVITGDAVRLHTLAAGLDPVWVARVSLPPVGVCVAGRAAGPALSADDLDGFERWLAQALPADYRAFLLNQNGGGLDFTPDSYDRGYPGHGWHFYPLLRSGFHRRDRHNGPLDLTSNVARHFDWLDADPEANARTRDWFARHIRVGHSGVDEYILLGVGDEVGSTDHVHELNEPHQHDPGPHRVRVAFAELLLGRP